MIRDVSSQRIHVLCMDNVWVCPLVNSQKSLPAFARVKMARVPNAYDKTALKLEPNDRIKVLKMDPSGTWQGELDGKIGNFPFTYVEWEDEPSWAVVTTTSLYPAMQVPFYIMHNTDVTIALRCTCTCFYFWLCHIVIILRCVCCGLDLLIKLSNACHVLIFVSSLLKIVCPFENFTMDILNRFAKWNWSDK